MRPCSLVQRLGNSFKIAYAKPWWLGLNAAITVLLGGFMLQFGFSDLPMPADSLYFLLSTLAATLATVFVLAFSFSFVAAQIAARYSPSLFLRMLGAWSLWYAIPFTVGILFPLFLLFGDFYLWSVRLSLLLAVFCLLSLLPFAVAVRRLLSIGDAILEKKTLLLDAASHDAMLKPLGELRNIAAGALNVRDFETFEFVLEQLVQSNQEEGKSAFLPELICEEMRLLILQNVDSQYGSEALILAMNKAVLLPIESSDMSSVERMMDSLTDAYTSVNLAVLRNCYSEMEALKDYIDVAIQQRLFRIVAKGQKLMYVIGDRTMPLFPMDSDSARWAANFLGAILLTEMSLVDNTPEQDGNARSAITQIEFLGTRAAAGGKEELKDIALTHLNRANNLRTSAAEMVRGNLEASIAAVQLAWEERAHH